MGTNSNDNTLIIGPIDTEAEVRLVLKLLAEHFRLRNSTITLQPLSQIELEKFMIELKAKRGEIIGPVDTPLELELFTNILRKQNKLSGDIDTPEEMRIFANHLKNQGYIFGARERVRPRPESENDIDVAPPKRKRPRYDD